MQSYEPSRILNSKYKIMKLISQGGMGAVYLGSEGEKNLAIKVMERSPPRSPVEIHSLLKKEFILLSSLSNPHIPKVFEYFEEGPFCHLVEEYIDGLTLKEEMSRNEYSRNLVELCNIFFQVTGVLYFLNRKKIIYRDLKPAHIIVTGKGFVRLVDYGAARVHKKGRSVDTIPLGTPGFASPEHYGYGQTDERSDVYSAGALLHNLLTGRHPAENPFRFEDPAPDNPVINVEMTKIIQKATSMERKRRYRNLKELRSDLDGAIATLLSGKRLVFCPLCRMEMEEIKVDNLVVDGCPECRGMWFDARELGRIQKIDNLSVSLDGYLDTDCPASDASRAICCPLCGLPMKVYHYAAGSTILLDRCPDGCGNWLDGGEIALIRKKLGKGAIRQMVRLLRSYFTREQRRGIL